MAQTDGSLTLYPKHPRLIFRDVDWEGGHGISVLRDRASHPDYRNIAKGIESRFGPLGRVMAYILTGQERHAQAAIRRLAAETFPEVHTGNEQPSKKLFIYPLAYDWVYNYSGFPLATKRRIEANLADVAEKLIAALDGTSPSLYHRRTSIASALAVIALALDHDPRRQKILERARYHYRTVAVEAIDFVEGWPEGYTYWALNRAVPNAIAAACWKSAVTSDDLFSVSNPRHDFLRKIAYWHIYGLRPDDTFVRYSDVSHQLGLKFEYRPFLDLVAQLYQDGYIASFVNYIHQRVGNRDYHPSDEYMFSFLFGYDYRIPRKPISELPLMAVFGKDSWGQVFMRENWQPDGTYITFKAGSYFAHHQGYDQGTFTIYRHAPLAIHSGSYGGFGTEHREGYWIRSVSRNTLLIYDPSENSYFGINDGGQRVINSRRSKIQSLGEWLINEERGPHYKTGKILGVGHAEGEYDYINADITDAYNSSRFDRSGFGGKVSLVTRQLVYLRPSLVVIFDRVHTTKPALTKKWVLHSVEKPKTVSETAVEGTTTAGILQSKDDEVIIENGKGRLFVRTLLPEDHIITKIGGHQGQPYGPDDYEFYVDGANRYRGMRKRSVYDLGSWRIEVSPTQDKKTTIFLHVLFPTDTTVSSMPVSKPIRSEAGDAMSGAYIMDEPSPRLVLFAVDAKPVRRVAYSVAGNRPVRHLVCNLQPRKTYDIRKNGARLKSAEVSAEGTIYFTDDPGGTSRYELRVGRAR